METKGETRGQRVGPLILKGRRNMEIDLKADSRLLRRRENV